MSAQTAQQPPVIPPRPSRSQEKASTPMVPPRPARRFQRSISPNPDRFAPSPLNESPLHKPSSSSLHPGGRNGNSGDHIPRSTSVDLPSLGEEGQEYAGLAQELASPNEEASSPEHTRTVGDDIKLHAPKPSLPAASAKQRVMAVTRTDSDKAASFGIGRPSSNDDSTHVLPSNRSLKKKASTTSQLSTTKSDVEDEHGIPEIGLQVPMYKNAGDVQAPSPAPLTAEGKHHKRRTSGPPGSYGLHGHGVISQDKLQKAYYEKHPELLKKEHIPHHYDRAQDFSLSSEDLNKIVRETVSRGSGLAVKNYPGTPSDQVAWQALEESTSRVASPSPAHGDTQPSTAASDSGKEARRPSSIRDVIHVDEPSRRRSVMFSDAESPDLQEEEKGYDAPILAEDEVAKDPSPYIHQPAVELSAEKLEESHSRPTSRPSSRPASLYKEPSFEMRSTPLEDVEEYEPLFDDDDDKPKKEPVKEENAKNGVKKQRFPSADIWEDAPSSVYYTAEVSTPDIKANEKSETLTITPTRDGETPAQAFARHQEELAEKENRERGSEGFVPRNNTQKKPVWAQHQPHLASEAKSAHPSMHNRFPSRDVWEDTPESLQLETTVSTPQQDNTASLVAASPVEQAKPEIPTRPKPRQASGDDKPAISDRPKPQVPARPAKAGPTSGGLEPAEAAAPPRQKPAVPARPTGSKIAALQAGFMSDLNRRLQLGPQAPKKEEPAPEEPVEEKEKVPLVDARKGRARGPQRRAPSAAKPESVEEEKSSFTFNISSAQTFFEIDPEEGSVSVGQAQKHADGESPAETEAQLEVKPEVTEKETSGVCPVAEQERQVEPEKKEETPAPVESKTEAEVESKPELESEAQPEKEETKTLATNMAGETLVDEQIKKDEKKDVVEPTKVEER